MNTWYIDFFKDIVLASWRGVQSDERTLAEADFIAQHFADQAHLLDTPCGNGRMAAPLLARGFRITGVDIADEFVAEARANHPDSEWICADMCTQDWRPDFDGAYCFGNSFGYFGPEQTALWFAKVAGALKPSGRFILETGLMAESILPNLQERDWYDLGDLTMLIRQEYIVDESRFDTHFIFHDKASKTETYRIAQHWVYTVREVVGLMKQAGLMIEDIYGDLRGAPFRPGDHETFFVVRKPGGRV